MARLKHPHTRRTINVPDSAADKWEAAGWLNLATPAEAPEAPQGDGQEAPEDDQEAPEDDGQEAPEAPEPATPTRRRRKASAPAEDGQAALVGDDNPGASAPGDNTDDAESVEAHQEAEK